MFLRPHAVVSGRVYVLGFSCLLEGLMQDGSVRTLCNLVIVNLDESVKTNST